MVAQSIGFLGLGTMGTGMAGRLVDAGFTVTVHNRTPARAEPLAERGARIATTPEAAVRDAGIVLVSLATGDAVEEVLFGADGAVGGLRPGAVIADMSTVAPAYARDAARRVHEAGGRALDACVLGNAQHARTGELRFMIGGAVDDVDTVRPVLETLSKEITHVGGSGAGTTAKLAMNLLMGVQMQALAEAVNFGVRAGLDRDVLISMIAASGYSSPVMRFKSGVMARRSYSRADFKLELMLKDMSLVLAEAQLAGAPMPATAASRRVLVDAVENGLGSDDCAAVLAQLEQSSRTA